MTARRLLSSLAALLAWAPPCAWAGIGVGDLEELRGRDKPEGEAWVLALPLRGPDPTDDDLGRAMGDLLGLAVFRHGGSALLRPTPAAAELRRGTFAELRDGLVESRVDVVLDGRFVPVGEDYLLLPRVTVLADAPEDTARLPEWRVRIAGEVEVRAGLDPGTWELPAMPLAGAVVAGFVDKDRWLVCAERPGPGGCTDVVGHLGYDFRVVDWVDGGQFARVSIAEGDGWVRIPLPPDSVGAAAEFVAGLTALMTGRDEEAQRHLDAVLAAAEDDPYIDTDLRVQSNLLGCMALQRRGGEGWVAGCGGRIDKASEQNRFDPDHASYKLLYLASALEGLDDLDQVRQRSMIAVFREGTEQFRHRLPVSAQDDLRRVYREVDYEAMAAEPESQWILAPAPEGPAAPQETSPRERRAIERELERNKSTPKDGRPGPSAPGDGGPVDAASSGPRILDARVEGKQRGGKWSISEAPRETKVYRGQDLGFDDPGVLVDYRAQLEALREAERVIEVDSSGRVVPQGKPGRRERRR